MRTILRYLTLSIAVTAAIVLSSCRKSNPPKDEGPTQHTLIFYFTGTQLSYYFDRNIDAAAKAIANGAAGNCRVLCFYQGSDRNNARIIELTKENGTCVEKTLATYQMPPITDGEDMAYFLSEMMRMAPAESYGLVIAGHATAWIPAAIPSATASMQPRMQRQDYWRKAPSDIVTRYFGEVYSQQASNHFEITDMADALAATGHKFRYLLFDACFMANIESAYILRNNADYIIGAPCEIIGDGFPYTDVLPQLLAGGGRATDIDGVCRAFYDYYASTYGYSGTVAAIDCSQIEPLAAIMKQINTSGSLSEVDRDELQTYEGQWQHIFFDLGDYVDKACGDATLKASFAEQLARCVPYKYTLSSFWSNYGVAGNYPVNRYSGISTSAPSEIYRYEYALTPWYTATH